MLSIASWLPLSSGSFINAKDEERFVEQIDDIDNSNSYLDGQMEKGFGRQIDFPIVVLTNHEGACCNFSFSSFRACFGFPTVYETCDLLHTTKGELKGEAVSGRGNDGDYFYVNEKNEQN